MSGYRSQSEEGLVAIYQKFPFFREVLKHEKHLSKHGIMGWDLVRFQVVLAWSYLTGYFSFDEARYMAINGTIAVQREFSSREELVRDYLLGFYCW